VSEPERDLGRLVASLEPHLHAERYAFEATSEETLTGGTFALAREDEGVSAIRITATGEWARISLGVHSSLEAVGLTALLSRQLAEAGISANVIAGLRHDHIFVPWNRRHEAIDLLQALAHQD
jgi:hypothetical protein